MRFVGTYVATSILFLGLFLLMSLFGDIDNILEARDRMSGGRLLWTVIALYGTRLPFMFARIAPFVMVTAAVLTVVRLRRTNEIVPMISAGRSARRILLPVFVVATVVAAVQLLAQDHLLPDLADTQRRLRRTLKGRDASVFETPRHFLDEAGVKFVCESYDADDVAMVAVTAERYAHRGRVWLLRAERLEWRSGAEGRGWYAVGGTLQETVEDPAAGAGARTTALGPDERVRTDLKPREVDLLAGTDGDLDIAAKEIRRLVRRNPGNVRLRLHLHGRRAFAVANVVLLLIGLPVAFRGSGRSTALGAGFCIVVCAAYFALDMLLRHSANLGALHPVVAAWLPVVVFLGVGVVLFDAITT
jgi:lipopolysaccharide export LptBFGC system permease protein LptF